MMEIAGEIKARYEEALEAAENGEDTEADAEVPENAETSDAEGTSDEPAETVDEDSAEPVEAYNALDDFIYLVKQGSRLGMHFLMALNTFADLKACGVKRDLFRYRMSFATSAEESRQIFDSKIAESLPEHICQFDDTYESYSFRPYLPKGVGWDGWGVDENGNVTDPMKI